MSLLLKINSVDKSNIVDWRSLVKTEGLTKEPDSLEFKIKQSGSKTVPVLGDVVELWEDSIKIFKGVLTEKRDYTLAGITLGYDLKCKDLIQNLDRQLVVKSYANQTARAIVLDIISTFTTGFTTTNVAASTPTITSLKFNYEPVSKALQKLADLIGFDWYVDYDGDIHFFDQSVNNAPYEIDDTNGNLIWSSLNFQRNILELKNSVIVRGGEYKSTISETDAVDKYEADGTQTVFSNIYKYANVSVKVGSTAKTVGVDNITDPAMVDCLYNFQEKAVKFRDDNKPTAGQIVKIYGDAYIPLIAKVRDQVSILTYGEYQHVLVDKTITSISEAQSMGKAELTKWSEGSYEGSFKTTKTGFKTGQKIRINSSIWGVDKYFKINRITGRAKASDQMEYEIQFLASGEITFADIMIKLLGKDRQNIEVSDSEVLQRLEIFNENVTIVETTTVTKTSPPYTWGAGGSNDTRWGFGTWG